MKEEYIAVENLEVYKLSMQLSDYVWEIYEKMDWHDKKIMGDQLISAIDSVGANIVEGYSRYHYLDKIKFYYISRGSLSEGCNHWLQLMYKRKKINEETYNQIYELFKAIEVKLNNFIKSTYKAKNNNLEKNKTDRHK